MITLGSPTREPRARRCRRLSPWTTHYTGLVDDHGGLIRLRIPLRIPLVSTPVLRRDENAQQ
jgi:hypothetical protein